MMPQDAARPARSPQPRSLSAPSGLTLGAVLGWIGLALAGCGGPSDPAEPGAPVPLTLENIFRDARGGVSQAAISPDGRWVAAVAESADGRGIHLLDLTEEPPVLRFWLTGSSPAWSPDGGRVAFLRDGNLFAAPVGDPDAAPLTDGLQGSPRSRLVSRRSNRRGHGERERQPKRLRTSGSSRRRAASPVNSPRGR